MSEAKKPLKVVGEPEEDHDATESIPKPGAFNLDKFKSKRGAAGGGVSTLQTALPHHKMAEAKDFVRLHPNEEDCWTDELCLVDVPVKGERGGSLLHLIDEDIIPPSLPSGRIKRFRLALATKPHDIFFLCHVPSQNLDNSWNETTLKACERGKRLWVMAVSQKNEGVEDYKIQIAEDQDAFPEPKWPKQSFVQLIEATFGDGRCIDNVDHPALRRLMGRKQL